MEVIKFDQQNIFVGIRPIERADEAALFASESAGLAHAVAKVRRQSGAARIIARALLAKLGFPPMPIPKTQSGVPTWPAGIVGSLAHHDTVAAAAVAEKKYIGALGIDIEPNERLPGGLIDVITTTREKRMYDRQFLNRRHIFVLKEAVYKAYFSLRSELIDFHDVEIDFYSRLAYVHRSNCIFDIEMYHSSNIIGLAYLREYANGISDP